MAEVRTHDGTSGSAIDLTLWAQDAGVSLNQSYGKHLGENVYYLHLEGDALRVGPGGMIRKGDDGKFQVLKA